jgi:tetratricopeptide (TPR) repeat protein
LEGVKLNDTDRTDNLDALLRKASKAASARKLDEAEQYLLPVLKRNPAHIKALDLLGFVRFFQKRYAECEQICRQVLTLEPNRAYAQSGLGMALARQGRLEEGLEMLTKAMTTTPAWSEPYWDAAVLLIEARNYARAREVLELGIQKAPRGTPRFKNLLAKLDILKS